MRVDGHIAVADLAALEASGITKATKDPEGGKIDRDVQGEATGILRETAQGLVHVPPPSPEDRRKGLELAIEDAVSHGVTSVQDFSDWEDFLVFEHGTRGQTAGAHLGVAAVCGSAERGEGTGGASSGDGSMLHTTMLKGFMDGSLGRGRRQ